MPNWSAIEASFLCQSYEQQLGELAASLARLNSWSQKSASRELVPILLSESLFYLSLIQQETEMNNIELNQLQDLLQNWIDFWDKSIEITDIESVASTWSQRLLEMSGLLTSKSMSA